MYCVIEQNYNRNQRTSVKITKMAQCMQDIMVPSQIATDQLRSTAKRLGNRCECHHSSLLIIWCNVPCRGTCGTLKNSHCSVAIIADLKTKRRAPMRIKLSSACDAKLKNKLPNPVSTIDNLSLCKHSDNLCVFVKIGVDKTVMQT